MSNYKKYLQSVTKNHPSSASQISFHMWVKYLGLRIGQIRDTLGYKQEDLAKKMGITQSAIARMEGGQNMTLQTLWKLGEAFNAEISIFGVSSSNIKNQLSSYIEGEEGITLQTVKNISQKEIKYKETPSATTLLSNNGTISISSSNSQFFNFSLHGQEPNVTTVKSGT